MFFSLLAVLIFVNGYSQECSKDLLAAKPGIFKPGMGGSIHNVTATDLAKEKAVLNTIFNKIKGLIPQQDVRRIIILFLGKI